MIKPSLRFSIYREPDIFNLYIFLHYFVKKKWLSAVLYVHSDFFFFLIFCCLPKNVRVPYTDIYFRLHETFYNDGSWSTQSTNSLWCQNCFPSSTKVKKGFAKKLINPISLLESFFVQKSVIRSRLSPDLFYLRAVAPCSIFSLVSVWRKSRTSLLIALYH